MFYFIGAGPGDPDLLTVKALKILQKADYVFYVKGLYLDRILEFCKNGTELIPIKNFGLAEQVSFIKEHQNFVIVRLHTGDLSLESGYRDLADRLLTENIAFECIPGVSSVSAALSSVVSDVLMIGNCNSFSVVKPFGPYIIPAGQSIKTLAGSGRGLAVFGVNRSTIRNIVAEYYEAGCTDEQFVCLVSRASMPEQKIIVLPLGKVVEKVLNDDSFNRFTILLSGNFLMAKTVGLTGKTRIFPEIVALEGN